jgi:hypothetical protein
MEKQKAMLGGIHMVNNFKKRTTITDVHNALEKNIYKTRQKT